MHVLNSSLNGKYLAIIILYRLASDILKILSVDSGRSWVEA